MIGSGPNGLAAAITLAAAGVHVIVHEGSDAIGGGVRSAELTLPGFVHDICSTVHPMAASSPFLEDLPLAAHGLDWVYPEASVAHPFDDGRAVMLERSLDLTCANLGPDGEAWRSLMDPLVEDWPALRHDVLAPPKLPRHPLRMARFGLHAVRSARSLAESRFRGMRARALFAGIAAHSILPLEKSPSAAIALVLAVAGHVTGWPFPRGGAQRLSDALAGHLRSLGGEIRIHSPISTLPDAPLVLCDITPRQLLALAGDKLPAGYRRSLERYRYGPGAFKVDWALDGPVPWRAAACARAATVHLGGTMEEIAESESAVWEGRVVERPFVLLVQTSLFDTSRAPAGKHTVWAYCHVPNGSTADMTDAIEAQIERFAPGFRQRVLGRHVFTPAALEQHNPNLVGGDVSGGANTMRQMILRPTLRSYTTPLRGVYLCSFSTPPGGGVHGMCGYGAARRALG